MAEGERSPHCQQCVDPLVKKPGPSLACPARASFEFAPIVSTPLGQAWAAVPAGHSRPQRVWEGTSGQGRRSRLLLWIILTGAAETNAGPSPPESRASRHAGVSRRELHVRVCSGSSYRHGDGSTVRSARASPAAQPPWHPSSPSQVGRRPGAPGLTGRLDGATMMGNFKLSTPSSESRVQVTRVALDSV